jgi:triosephosphate isomerase
MTRQFFVGGNFKMNPASRDAKRALIKTLNEATLDPNTGEQSSYIATLLDLTLQSQRLSLHPRPCI